MSDDEQELEAYEITYDGDENKKSYINVKRGGKAKATFPDGATYEGSYKNGLRDGSGKYTFARGAGWYKGEWAGGVRQGLGTQRYPDKSKYTGQWKNDQRHGMGTYTYANGDRYCGHWVADVKEGPGTYVYSSDGSSFSGEWKAGQCRDGEWAYHDKEPFVAQVVRGKVTQYGTGQ